MKCSLMLKQFKCELNIMKALKNLKIFTDYFEELKVLDFLKLMKTIRSNVIKIGS